MAAGMKAPLYTTELLRLAASLGDAHSLERQDGFADLRSPTCGSRVQLSVQLDRERRVQQLSMKVHSCAFGQAAAALVERHSCGKDRGDVSCALLRLSQWLAGETDEASAWPGLEALEPARSRSSRHQAILLPFRALLAAIEAAP
jgi:NifU-like protein involved in Fe-S cluster formation